MQVKLKLNRIQTHHLCAVEQEHKTELLAKEKEHKVREGKGKENMAKLTDHSGVNARVAKAQVTLNFKSLTDTLF